MSAATNAGPMFFAEWRRHGETHYAAAASTADLEAQMRAHRSPPVYGTAHCWQALRAQPEPTNLNP